MWGKTYMFTTFVDVYISITSIDGEPFVLAIGKK